MQMGKDEGSVSPEARILRLRLVLRPKPSTKVCIKAQYGMRRDTNRRIMIVTGQANVRPKIQSGASPSIVPLVTVVYRGQRRRESTATDAESVENNPYAYLGMAHNDIFRCQSAKLVKQYKQDVWGGTWH